MMKLLKWPVVLAAIAVVLRVVLEQAGMTGLAVNLVSIVALYLVICPVYFALQIAATDDPHPYKTHIGITAFYTALCRAMVIPTYWLAYAYQWTAPRFQIANGGVVGPGSSVLYTIGFPFAAALIWILASIVIGGGIGSLVIKFSRRPR